MVLAESPNSTSGATNSALNERARILTNTNALRPGIDHKERQETMPASAHLTVSAIIPTKNRPDELLLVVRGLLAQSVLPSQVIIIDQSESDEGRILVEHEFNDAPENIRQSIRLDYVSDARITGLAVARNRSMKIALGSVWLFLDDDVELESDFVEQLLKVYSASPDAGGVSGVITNYLPPSRTFRLWASIFFRGPFHDERQPIYWNCDRLRNARPIPVHKFGGGLMSFRADLMGGRTFDTNLTGVSLAEDVDFCARLPKTKLLITPGARLVHKRNAVGRAQDHWLRAEVQASYYLYGRNWKHGFKNRLCFFWLNIGFGAMIAMLCIKRRSLEAWHSFNAGRRVAEKILQANRSVPITDFQ
jgi:GT2 family glycosyltransferase